MKGVEPGFRPGWIVTYAPESKAYGTAFFVSFMGKPLARGTPSIVQAQKEEALKDIEEFCRDFARKDAAAKVGNNFPNAELTLGRPILVETNNDGTCDAYYSYPLPSVYVPIDWLTNGFSLRVSNNVIVRKEYSYTRRR